MPLLTLGASPHPPDRPPGAILFLQQLGAGRACTRVDRVTSVVSAPPHAGRVVVGSSTQNGVALRACSLVLGYSFSYNICMNTQLKVTKIGNSAGVVLPKELLAHLDAAIGETLSVTKTPRGIELSSREPDFDAQMASAREVMKRRKRALRELAK